MLHPKYYIIEFVGHECAMNFNDAGNLNDSKRESFTQKFTL